MSIERRCIAPGCKEKIEECNGFVLARDIIAFLNGERRDMRELCGKDALLMSIAVDFYGVNHGQYVGALLYQP